MKVSHRFSVLLGILVVFNIGCVYLVASEEISGTPRSEYYKDDRPRFVVLDTATLASQQLFFVLPEPWFRDSSTRAKDVVLLGTQCVHGTVVIQPGDIITFPVYVGSDALSFRGGGNQQDTIFYAQVDEVFLSSWVQQHRERNWKRLREEVPKRFDKGSMRTIAASLENQIAKR